MCAEGVPGLSRRLPVTHSALTLGRPVAWSSASPSCADFAVSQGLPRLQAPSHGSLLLPQTETVCGASLWPWVRLSPCPVLRPQLENGKTQVPVPA